MIDFLKKLFQGKEPLYKNLNVNQFKATAKLPHTILIDVRTPAEYKAGKIKKAKNINVSSFNFMKDAEKLDKSKHLLVYCRSGARSARACNMLTKMGFEKVSNLVGGIQAWQNNGEKVA